MFCSMSRVIPIPYFVTQKNSGFNNSKKNASKHHFNLQDYKINDKPHLFSILLQGQEKRRRDSVLKLKKKKKLGSLNQVKLNLSRTIMPTKAK